MSPRRPLTEIDVDDVPDPVSNPVIKIVFWLVGIVVAAIVTVMAIEARLDARYETREAHAADLGWLKESIQEIKTSLSNIDAKIDKHRDQHAAAGMGK